MSDWFFRDSQTGSWNVKTVLDNKVSPSETDKTSDKKSSGSGKKSSGKKSSGGTGSSNATAKTGASKSAQDKFDEVVLEACDGDLTPVIAIPQMPSRACINVLGVGNVLSGKYYVKSVRLHGSASGFTQSISVRKTEFGGSLRVADDSRDGRPSPLLK